jgi:hypothetical protein
MSSRSHSTTNFHHKPHLDLNDLAEFSEEGLSKHVGLLTGCYFGYVIHALTGKLAIVPTAVVSGLMLIVAFITGLLAASALSSTGDVLSGGGSPDRGDLIRAYTGGAFGVVATTAVLFALILVMHQFATRPGPDRLDGKRAAHQDSYQ